MKTSKKYSLAEAAEYFGTQQATVSTWVKSGLLPRADDGTFDERELGRFSPKNHSSAATGMRVVSFFSGCGGLDLGFQNAGFQLGYANDFFLGAVKTYEKNIGPIDPRSIYEIGSEDVGSADVVLAGFPCQPFSNAGSRRGTSDPRGTLFWETLRFIDSSKPKVVVFENVRGLLSIKNPDGELLINAIKREVEARGYIVNFKLLNANDYGVPQNRHRVFVIGVRAGEGFGAFDFDKIVRSEGSKIESALVGLPTDDPNDEHWELSPQAKHLVKFIPEGGSWKSVPYEELPLRLKKIRDDMTRYHSPNFYRRFGYGEVMGTVTAAATPENSGILHPREPRRYTVREIARFQSFPDKFLFMGKGISEKYKQIGNAVPPKLAECLASAIRDQYFKASDSTS